MTRATHVPSLLILTALAGACAFESTATAHRVPVPVLVGPVEQIGGAPRPSSADDGPQFDIKVDRTVTASSSSQTSGNVTVTTTTATASTAGAGLVDARVRLAANGAKNRLVRVDQLRVNSYSGFFYSAAWISSRVRIKGHVGRDVVLPDAPALAPGIESPPGDTTNSNAAATTTPAANSNLR
ncbi:MAG: hypothetical protein IPH07_34865 [Deltaproteobacteria bacterium]|nr:hypothetical protein [Deltaproteobacteria bacterium]MBK8235362.1 hypothetical protein [Deltaproteobacteria bacterium]MBP7291423.1 hypothetical protein [Nannocystaceae bacterium]